MTVSLRPGESQMILLTQKEADKSLQCSFTSRVTLGRAATPAPQTPAPQAQQPLTQHLPHQQQPPQPTPTFPQHPPVMAAAPAYAPYPGGMDSYGAAPPQLQPSSPEPQFTGLGAFGLRAQEQQPSPPPAAHPAPTQPAGQVRPSAPSASGLPPLAALRQTPQEW